MKGIFKYDDCIIEDPKIKLISRDENYETNVTIVTVDVYGKNRGHVDTVEDTFRLEISSEKNKLPVSTSKPAVTAWAEKHIQQLRYTTK